MFKVTGSTLAQTLCSISHVALHIVQILSPVLLTCRCMQSIASKLREPEHATPPIVQEVKDHIKGQQTLDSTAGEKKKSSRAPNEQQARLTDKIVSEGLEKVDRRSLDKQAEITSGTPTEV